MTDNSVPQQSTKAPVLEAVSLTRRVSAADGDLTILDDVSFSAAAGESLAVIGPSGAGKSTLLALLAGLDLPTSGYVALDGIRLDGLDEDGRAKVRAGRVGFVFQSFHLIPALSALENVMMPLELAGVGDARKLATEVLDQVGLSQRLRHYPTQLSGGEKQRVAIARAFASRPRVMFADEPTGNLDTNTGDKIEQLLFDLNRDHGATLVVVTHDEALAAKCQRRLTLDAGKLVADEVL
ncbi:MAG: ATP-binding cassette domain-containing protein [Pseudomonadota bacterium]